MLVLRLLQSLLAALVMQSDLCRRWMAEIDHTLTYRFYAAILIRCQIVCLFRCSLMGCRYP